MLTLTPDEIVQLTSRVQKAKQCESLKQLGIPFKIRGDGTPVVLRVAMEVALGYATTTKGPTSASLRVPQALKLLVRQEGKMAKTG